MDRERLIKFIGDTSMTVVDAMAKIDTNAKGILFIEDGHGMLCGCITDGDIRRWILKAGGLDTSVHEAMTKMPRYLFLNEIDKAEDLMRQEMVTAVPILDKNRHIVDISLLSESGTRQKEKKKKDLSLVPVVIMAGGKGTRLYPFTKILPKPLIPIGDTPIIERIIDRFVSYGIARYYITVNYKKGMIRSYFADLAPSYDIRYVEETRPLGTGGSIKLIEDKLDRPLFVVNCDALIGADYGDIYDHHIRSGNAVTVVAALKNIIVPYGVIHPGDNGEIKSMEEKPRLSYFVNTGMYVIDPAMIERIPDDTIFHMTDLVGAAMAAGDKIGMYPISEDSFLDMGEFSEMKRMEEKLDLSDRDRRDGQI